jgi:hypothetical protein
MFIGALDQLPANPSGTESPEGFFFRRNKKGPTLIMPVPFLMQTSFTWLVYSSL